MKTPESIARLMLQRKQNNRYRTLKTSDYRMIDFWSNDYLGIASGKEIQQLFLDYLKSHENENLFGSTGSRLVSGNMPVFEKAEAELAVFFNSEAALLFPSGYVANLAFCSAVPQKKDLVLYDAECHASIKASLRQSNASFRSFKHNDLGDLKKKIADRSSEVYVIVESIYSISGDMAPLEELAELCSEKACRLVVDEAHSTGIYGPQGRGLSVEYGIENSVFARIHTFGKAVGAAGAIIACSKEMKDYLINFALPFIYSTAMPPVQVHSILFNLDYIRNNSNLIQVLKNNIQFFKEMAFKSGLGNLFSNFNQILNLKVGADDVANNLSKAMQNKGIMIKAMLPPTVPVSKSSLRIIMHSFNSYEEIENFFLHIKKLF